MQLLSLEAFRLIYGLTYFILGLTLGARVLAYQPSEFRNRLLALASFGILHACAIWLLLFNSAGSEISSHAKTVFYAASFLSLYYFALGWNERWPMLAHATVLATICSLILA